LEWVEDRIARATPLAEGDIKRLHGLVPRITIH